MGSSVSRMQHKEEGRSGGNFQGWRRPGRCLGDGISPHMGLRGCRARVVAVGEAWVLPQQDGVCQLDCVRSACHSVQTDWGLMS